MFASLTERLMPFGFLREPGCRVERCVMRVGGDGCYYIRIMQTMIEHMDYLLAQSFADRNALLLDEQTNTPCKVRIMDMTPVVSAVKGDIRLVSVMPKNEGVLLLSTQGHQFAQLVGRDDVYALAVALDGIGWHLMVKIRLRDVREYENVRILDYEALIPDELACARLVDAVENGWLTEHEMPIDADGTVHETLTDADAEGRGLLSDSDMNHLLAFPKSQRRVFLIMDTPSVKPAITVLDTKPIVGARVRDARTVEVGVGRKNDGRVILSKDQYPFAYADNQKPLRRLAAVLKRHDLALIVQIRSTGWIHGTLSTPDYRMQIPGDDMIRRFVNAINAGWLPSRLTSNKRTSNSKQREFHRGQHTAWIL